jgi:hypothetical protein
MKRWRAAVASTAAPNCLARNSEPLSVWSGEPPDVEAVQLDLRPRLDGVDVPGGRRQLGLALVGIAVAGDQGQALDPRIQTDAARRPPHAVLADPDSAPLRAASSALIRPGP